MKSLKVLKLKHVVVRGSDAGVSHCDAVCGEACGAECDVANCGAVRRCRRGPDEELVRGCCGPAAVGLGGALASRCGA